MKHKMKLTHTVFPYLLSALLIALVTTVVTTPARAGDLLVSSATNEVLRYDGQTGAFIDAFVTAGSGGLSGPTGLVFGPDGNLYVSSFNNNQVLRYDGTTGAFIDVFVPPGGGGLNVPTGLVFGPDGNLYVSSIGTDEVLRYDGTTGAFIDAFVTAGGGGLRGPIGLVFGPDGNLYVGSGTNEVLRYDGQTGAFIDAFVTAGSGGLLGSAGLVFRSPALLFLSPASGTYSTTQNFDLSLILKVSGDPVSVVGASATLNGADVTAALVGCIIPGTLVSGGSTFRCPGLRGAFLGTGTHTLEVTLDLSDGSSVSDTVIWEVVENTEP